jgi:hypothetical protein
MLDLNENLDVTATPEHAAQPPGAASAGKVPVTARLMPRSTQIFLSVGDTATALDLAGRLGGAGPEAAVERAAAGTSTSLPSDLRLRFESCLDTDLSGVRVHTGSDSADAAAAVGAKAYAIGQDIHFGAGQFEPGTEAGQHLIAHEVVHTVQQRGATAAQTQFALEVSQPHDPAEVEAESAASQMVGWSAASAPVRVGVTPVPIAHRTPIMLSREPAGAPAPAAAAALTEADKALLANATQLVVKAAGAVSGTAGVLTAFGNQADSHLATLKSGFDAAMVLYEAAHEHVNDIIAKAASIRAIQEAVLDQLIDLAFGQIAGKLGEIATGLAVPKGELNVGFDNINAVSVGGAKNVGIGAGDVADAAAANATTGMDQDAAAIVGEGQGRATSAAKGTAMGSGGGGSSTTAPGGKQLAFYQQYSALQSGTGALVKLAMQTGSAQAKIAQVQEAIAGITSADKTRPDYPLDKLQDDAARLESGARSIAAAGPGVQAKLGEIAGAVAAASAAAPKDRKEVEREVWTDWVANLSHDSTEQVNYDLIEQELLKVGVAANLGVKDQLESGYTSDDDEALAVVSARAQQKVMAHKGSTIEVETATGRATVGELGELPMTVDRAGWSTPCIRVSAVVIGATTAPLDASVLEQGPKDKDSLALYLIRSGKVTVQLRVVADLTEERTGTTTVE